MSIAMSSAAQADARSWSCRSCASSLPGPRHSRVSRLLPLLEARKYRRQDRCAARALIGEERQRCHDHNEDGRYERGKDNKLYGSAEAVVHAKTQEKMQPPVNV